MSDVASSALRSSTYVLICRECGDDLHQPFESAEARGRWAGAHTGGTGHARWLVFDVPGHVEHPLAWVIAQVLPIQRAEAADADRRRLVIIETLRFLAGGWTGDEFSDHYVEVAVALESPGWCESISWCCPLCQEVACDEGCPVAPLRRVSA